MSKVANDWFDLPRPGQGIRLYETREELREKNLHDTEEPPLESSTTPRLVTPTTCAPATACTTT